jgi:hypothetical protein
MSELNPEPEITMKPAKSGMVIDHDRLHSNLLNQILKELQEIREMLKKEQK